MALSRRHLVPVAALAAAALAAGCGGGGSDALGADEFREQADAICADADERLEALTEPGSADQILPFLRAGLPIAAEELASIGELDPPDDLQAAFDDAQRLNERRQELIAQAADRIEAGEDPEAVIEEVNPEVDDLQAQARERARGLGLTVCGTPDEDEGRTATAPALTASTAPTAPDTSSTVPGDPAQVRYVDDLRQAGAALQEFGTILRDTGSFEQFQGEIPQARAAVDGFAAAVERMGGYELQDTTLEARRAALAAQGEEVTATLRRFLDTAESGEESDVVALAPEVQSAILEFGRAGGMPADP